MNTLDFIAQKYTLDLNVRRMPIEIPDTNRDDLATLFGELEFRSGVEVGVERGIYTEILCRCNPQAIIYGVDAWRAYPGYREHVSQEQQDETYAAAQERLAVYSSRAELIRKFSLDAALDFEDGSLDFVYIDGSHELLQVVGDLAAWSRKVRTGGIVSGHDYRRTTNDSPLHVVQAVYAYTDAYHITPWFVLGRKERLPHETRERSRSFMWVKP